MSSYIAKARNHKTGEIVKVFCIDNYYGQRGYGYTIEGSAPETKPMTEHEFYAEWSEIISEEVKP